ncbi:MAG: methyl-accepting chemotaxis protein [Acidobacteriota bacterium]
MKLKLGLSFILVVTAIYITNVLVTMTIKPSLRHDIIVAMSAIAIGGFAAIFLSSYLTKNLKELTKTASVLSEGDLTVKANIKSEDEIGELATSFNKMLNSLLNVIQEVQSTSGEIYDMARTLSTAADEMNATAEEISETSETIASGTISQAEMVKRTSEIIRDMALSTEEISEKARLTFSYASRAAENARQGGDYARLAIDKINDASKSIERAFQIVEGFRTRALEINKIVEFITSISQQTHLLALNATIEAAKAGEEGKGFSVVAEEIRKLAENVRRFAEQISKIVQEINSESAAVMNVMDATVKAAIDGRNVVLSAGRSLDDIIQAVHSTSGKMQEITIAAEKQVKGSESLVKAIDEIARIAESNARGAREASRAVDEQHVSMKELSNSASKLIRTSDQLKDLISIFRIG